MPRFWWDMPPLKSAPLGAATAAAAAAAVAAGGAAEAPAPGGAGEARAGNDAAAAEAAAARGGDADDGCHSPGSANRQRLLARVRDARAAAGTALHAQAPCVRSTVCLTA
jgi:hypothetical protein